jgi:hypothetical protein
MRGRAGAWLEMKEERGASIGTEKGSSLQSSWSISVSNLLVFSAVSRGVVGALAVS